jgi:D-glycero-D-manno-heptose 1,7-bisphosphate phosphatase
MEAASRHRLDLDSSYMVGDRWRDITAGKAAGCRTVKIERGYKEAVVDDADVTVTEFMEATDWILADLEQRRRVCV